MKIKYYITSVFLMLGLFACTKQTDKNIPDSQALPQQALPSNTPNPSPTPSPTPISSPSPSPEPSSSSVPEKGVYYVVKRFSATTPEGLHGFSVGKQVTLVREEGGDFIVSDGTVEGKAPKDFFSNDQNEIALSQQTQANALARARIQQSKLFEEAQIEADRTRQAAAEADKARLANVENSNRNKIKNQIAQLDANIAAASDALQKIYQAKARGGDYYDQYGHKKGTTVTSANGDSKQLENNISIWQRQKAALQNQLR